MIGNLARALGPQPWGKSQSPLTMLPYRIAPFPDSSARKNRGLGVEKVDFKKFSEWGLPGVEIVPTSLESLFNISRAPQGPYIKNLNFGKLIKLINLFY